MMNGRYPRVATVLMESKGQYGRTDNEERLKVLLETIKKTTPKTTGSGIILFPAGYLQTGRFKPSYKKYHQWTTPIKRALTLIKNRRVIICFGIDGRFNLENPLKSPKDQIVLAVDRTGVIAAARKFHPTKSEKSEIEVADNYLAGEKNKPRIFKLSGKRYYLAVCYDVFGICQRNLPNPGVDGILNPIHKFTARCQCEGEICKCGATSGEVYFARHGMAGASMKWGVPVYGSVVFYERKIPTKWPCGVLVGGKSLNMKAWKYEDNALIIFDKFDIAFGQIKITGMYSS